MGLMIGHPGVGAARGVVGLGVGAVLPGQVYPLVLNAQIQAHF